MMVHQVMTNLVK